MTQFSFIVEHLPTEYRVLFQQSMIQTRALLFRDPDQSIDDHLHRVLEVTLPEGSIYLPGELLKEGSEDISHEPVSYGSHKYDTYLIPQQGKGMFELCHTYTTHCDSEGRETSRYCMFLPRKRCKHQGVLNQDEAWYNAFQAASYL